MSINYVNVLIIRLIRAIMVKVFRTGYSLSKIFKLKGENCKCYLALQDLVRKQAHRCN